ncbi:retrotransposon protein, putative, ty1-copia subclass [Tanacetum coccineum]
MFVIEQPLPAAPAANSDAQVLLEWNAVYDAYNEVACLILGSMIAELHRQFKNSSPYDMITELKAMFEKQAEVERFDLIQTFHACKQEEGLPQFAAFLYPDDMHVRSIGTSWLCVTTGLPKKAKIPQVMMIKSGKIQKANKKSLKVKGKGKANSKRKDKQVYIPKPSAKEHPAKDNAIATHFCQRGGWSLEGKGNCHVYLAELLKKKKQVGSASSSEARKLKQGALYLYLGNGVCAQVEAIRSFDLVLPNGLVICLDNCHYAPSILRGVVSVHCLIENGFVQRFTDFGISVSKNNVYYFNAIPSNGVKNEVENQLGKTIKALRSDRGGEYISQEFKDYLKACGIVQQLTPPYTPQHNGVSEWRNHTLLDMKVDKTPYELWYGKVPNLSYLKVWGCEALVKRDTPDKIQQRSIKCIFIGYPKETMGYYFYFPPENKIVVASKIPMEVEGFEPPQEEEILIRRSLGWRDSESNKWIDDMNAGNTIHDGPYGKQASRSWNKRFDEEIKRFGFAQNLDEPCVYQKASGSNVTFLILYVDDIIIMGNHIPSLQSVKDYLGKCFAMKDLGEAAFILGIKIYRDRSKRLIGLSQNAYMDKILKRYKMDNSKRGHIPMQERLDLNKSQGAQTPKEVNRMKNVPYASAVGSIMYAVRCTRPDVAFAQNMTSRFQQNPGELHWTAVKNILKYLRNTKDMFLVYGGNPSTELRVECYCNAGFETDIDDMKSLTGYVSF